MLLVTGCAQTATVLDPAKMACYAKCTPNGGCEVRFRGSEEKNIETSDLLSSDGVHDATPESGKSPSE